MKKLLLLPLLMLLLFSCRKPGITSSPARNKFHDPALRTIYTLQDERNTAQLLPFLKASDPVHRELAATAFASLQEKTAVPQLTDLLTDPVANVRKAAAYALGQTADAAAENAL
ncbi:MAG TPA: HEAT repeat domain-containing protein, partial [Adhaeribacter sp.]|nr:HEAT repeat domain-containing protein [Adhaeribacter sp.]